METVCLSLGSNLGDRLDHLARAVNGLGTFLYVERCSSVYETSPVGDYNQPPFLNMVVTARSDRSAVQLMESLLALEQQLGRTRNNAGEPRTIDIDLLFFGYSVINEASCIVPHPRYHQRAFVLKPICDIIPDFMCPVRRKTMKQLLSELRTNDRVTFFCALGNQPRPLAS